MPRIRVNIDVLRQKANEFTECRNEQRQIIVDVANLIQDILLNWEGEAQTGFISAFETARPMYERFSGDTSTFVNFLNNYAGTMEYLDVGGREEIQGSTGDNNSVPTPPSRETFANHDNDGHGSHIDTDDYVQDAVPQEAVLSWDYEGLLRDYFKERHLPFYGREVVDFVHATHLDTHLDSGNRGSWSRAVVVFYEELRKNGLIYGPKNVFSDSPEEIKVAKQEWVNKVDEIVAKMREDGLLGDVQPDPPVIVIPTPPEEDDHRRPPIIPTPPKKDDRRRSTGA